jgi:hypothetical protein
MNITSPKEQNKASEADSTEMEKNELPNEEFNIIVRKQHMGKKERTPSPKKFWS